MDLKWYKSEKRDFSNIQDKSGVYVISVLRADGKYAVVYVGKSENLHTRIVEHFSDSEQNESLKKCLKNNHDIKVNYAYVDKSCLNVFELYLYKKFNPPCNKIEPPGNNAVDCNHPAFVKY